MNTAQNLVLWQYRLRRLGWPGGLGLGALMVLVVAWFAVGEPQRLRLQQLQAKIAATTAALEQRRGSAADLTPPQQLAAFYGSLPKAADVPDILGRLNGQAAEQRLALETGEYALTPAGASAVDQLRITLPLRGNYPQIRRFIAAALADQPALALQSLQMRRDKIGDDQVEGRLVFVLFVEHAP